MIALESEDDFVARVTDIAYQAVLRHGLDRPFLSVELELWHEIRRAYRRREREAATPAERSTAGAFA